MAGAASSAEATSSGTLTFLFTDLEGSTRLWEQHPEAMKRVLERHDETLRTAIEAGGGTVVKTMGDGLMAVFPTAPDALRAALVSQRSIAEEAWEVGSLRVRMGLHAGVAHASDGDYHGRAVNRAARIMGVAHGGQVLVSGAVAALLGDELPDGAALRDLGEHRLRDLERAEHLFEVVHPGRPADLPPLTSLSERPNNLPTQTSSFVGRERELTEVAARIADPDVRLLTLTGPGGTGKTRLAFQVAAEAVDRFDDGVFLVDLADARDEASLLARITRAVGLEESPAGPGLDDVSAQLRDRSTLLLLDNFEQVTAAATTVVALLEACPGLEVLVTSREALRVRGERVLEVPPLGVSEGGAASRSEAVELFVDRARSVRPDLELTDEELEIVAAICARLDGLPLAIELAAARLNLFTPQQLLDRLREGTRVLGGGPRDLPARQQTLRDTIAWSYELLDPSERLLFELLSVFSRVSVASAEGVLDELGEELPEPVDALDGLASLVAKSLLRREDDTAGGPRFVMLLTIREYAAERLERTPELAAAARRAHATHFADHAEAQRAVLAERKRSEIIDELTADADDLQSAWRYGVEAGDLGRLDQLVHPLWLLYDAHGWHRATVELTTDMLAVLAESPSTPEGAAQEVTLRTSLARVLLATKGYTDEVADVYRRALELAEREGGLDIFPVLRGLSSLYTFRGQNAEAAEIAGKLLELAEEEGDRSQLAEAHFLVGASAAFDDDLATGHAHLDRAIELMDPEVDMARRFRFGPYPGVACLTTSAFVLWEQGYADQARRRTDRALAIATELDHPLTLAYACYHVGYHHLLWGEPDVALEQGPRVCAVADEHDLTLWRALGDCLEGAARTLSGADEGFAQFERGFSVYRDLTTPPVFWPFLLRLRAMSLAEADRPDEALETLQAAMGAATEMGAGGETGRLVVPGFLLLLGDLLLASSQGDRETAAETYEEALAIAEDLDLRMPRLAAATALYRLRRDGSGREEARRRLRAAHDGLTEGFDTLPALEAAVLLDGGG